MSGPDFRVTVHYESRATHQDLYTRKAARLHAKRLAGTAGVLRITLDSPYEASELWAKGDTAPAIAAAHPPRPASWTRPALGRRA